MTHDESPVEALLAQAIEALRSAQTLPPTERGGARRRAAEAIVSAREYFYTSDGRPDWSGRTRAYRDFIAEVYSNAGVTRDDLASEQAAVRYHVGNVVRERVSDADLEDAGYRVASPRQRSIDRRTARSELLAQVSGGPLTTGEDILRAATLAHSLLARITATAARALPIAERRALGAEVDAISAEVTRLRDALPAPLPNNNH